MTIEIIEHNGLEFFPERKVIELNPAVVFSGLPPSLPTATTPLQPDDKMIIRQGDEWREVGENYVGKKALYINLGRFYYTNNDYVDNRWLTALYMYGFAHYNHTTAVTDDNILNPSCFYPSLFGIGKKILIERIYIYANGIYGDKNTQITTRITKGNPLTQDIHIDIINEQIMAVYNYKPVVLVDGDISQIINTDERIYIYFKMNKNIQLWNVSVYIKYKEL